MHELRDHPQIDQALKTGYPYPEEIHLCALCGGSVAYAYSDTEGGYLCRCCAEDIAERQWGEISLDEKLDCLGIDLL